MASVGFTFRLYFPFSKKTAEQLSTETELACLQTLDSTSSSRVTLDKALSSLGLTLLCVKLEE